MEASASATTPSLAWKWILEKLVDIPDIDLSFLDGVVSRHVPDMEEPEGRPLEMRVALRFLEDLAGGDQIVSDGIPLLEKICGLNVDPGTTADSLKQRFNEELLLRFKTEVVLSVLRRDVDKGEKDWALYESELQRVFGEGEDNNRLLDRKRELRALLKPNNQTMETVSSLFGKFPLNILKCDVRAFLEEKRESLKTVFLDQLSRDHFNANGELFSEDDVDVEKSSKLEANGTQDYVGIVNVESLRELEDKDHQDMGQNPNLNVVGDQHTFLGTGIVSGTKRLWLEHCSENGMNDIKLEGVAVMKKSRKSRSTSIDSPLKTLLHQDVSELAEPESVCRGCWFPVKKEVDSGEEPLSGPRNLGPEVMRSCSPVAHESTSMEKRELPLRETRTDKRGVSDSETQNGSDRGHCQDIQETEVVKETLSLEREKETLIDGRKEACPGPSGVNVYQQEDNGRFVSKNERKPLDSEDIYEIEYLDVGSDGHEEVCHMCGEHGELLCCEGCPISMHLNCIKVLDLELRKSADWNCPVCLSRKAAQKAVEAREAAVAANAELKIFKMKSIKMPISPVCYSRRNKDIKRSSLPNVLVQSDEKDRMMTRAAVAGKDKLQVFEMELQERQICPVRHSMRETDTRRSSLPNMALQSEVEPRAVTPTQLNDEEPNLGCTDRQQSNLTGPDVLGSYLRGGRWRFPGHRRKPLPWTKQEELVLKEGVKRFSNGGTWGFQWKRILEFGRGTFDPSRTDVDLKDKWRNLIKGVSVR